METAGIAYSNSKLAILYYAHELQRGVSVAVFEPGFLPGTGLSRAHGATVRRRSAVPSSGSPGFRRRPDPVPHWHPSCSTTAGHT
jgi:hypothetical protein